MIESTGLSGFWAGMIVQGMDATRVFVSLSAENGAITGSYEVPTSPSLFRTGTIGGTYSDDYLTLTLSQGDAHGSLEFTLRAIQNDSDYMILGHTVTENGKFASVTFFRFAVGGGFKQISGIWP